MFAILLTDKMDGFYSIVTSFPTVIFSVFLIVSIFYWLISFLGVVDIDVLDTDLADGDVGGNGVAGLAMKLGLNGVPLPIIISLVSATGWFFSYYIVYFAFPFVPDFFEPFVGIAVFLAALYAAIVVTSQVIKPLRKLFKQADQHIEKTIVGQIGVVRTGRVDKDFGEATVEDGGAGLLVKVRSYKDEVFERGDRIVLLEYVESKNIYKVVSESDFCD